MPNVNHRIHSSRSSRSQVALGRRKAASLVTPVFQRAFLPCLCIAIIILCGCEPVYKFTITDGNVSPLLQIDRRGVVQPYAPIYPEADGEDVDGEQSSSQEFMVRRADGKIVFRADGTEHAIYLLGALQHVPDLTPSENDPEFIIRDPYGEAAAIIDADGNLKYTRRIGMLLMQEITTPQYIPCATLDVTLQLYYYDLATVTALGIQTVLPQGWTYREWLEGTTPPILPAAGSNVLDFAWMSTPTLPETLRFRVDVPHDAQGDLEIESAALYYTDGGTLQTPTATTLVTSGGQPEGDCGEGEGGSEGEGEGEGGGEGDGEGTKGPCEECPIPTTLHSADTNGDYQIQLSELLRVIQFFNLSGYACDINEGEGDTSTILSFCKRC